jgi:PGF-pre-PGF domain-containing protein
VTLAVVTATATPFVVGVASAAPTPITQCTDITQPGRYVFANDIIDATPSLSDPCIEVFASNVHIDGAGYTLDGTWTGGGTVQYGIFFPPFGSGLSLTNVSVTNLTFTDLGTAINLGAVSDFEVSNNTFTTSSGVLTTAVVANTGTQTPVTDGRIADNRMLDVRRGVASNGFDANVVIERNEIILESQGRTGISVVGGAAGVTIASNTVDATAATGATGIRLNERFSGQSGVNDISSNVVTGAEYGVFLNAISGNSVTTDLSSNTVSGSTEADFVNRGDDTVTIINATLDTARVTFDAQNALVSAADPTPTPPSGLTDIGRFVAAGSYFDTRPSSLVLTLRYQDADVSSVDESTLALYEYNVSTDSWTTVPGGAADTAANVIGPVSVPLEQARFTDQNTFADFVDFQQVFAPLASPSGTTVVVDDDGTDRSVTVTGAETGDPVEIPLEQTVSDDVTLDSITVTTSVDTDYTLDVTVNDTAPSGTTALAIAGPNGTVSFGYITVGESLLDSEIKEVVFRFFVDRDALAAAGVDPADVTLYRYDSTGTVATALPTTLVGVNSANGDLIFEATSPGFSVFGVAGLVPNIVVTAASVNESEVLLGESALVTASVENDGGAEGSATLNLTVDGIVVDAKTVTLAPGASTTVEFIYTFAAAGTDDLAVDGVAAGTVLVKLPVDIDVQPDDTPNELPPSPNAAVPVAVLGSASFDPTTGLDVSTVRFGAESDLERGGGAVAFSTDVTDVDGDGLDDLVLVFKNGDTGFDETNTLAVLTGETDGGLTVYGTDTVTVKTKGNGKK